MVNKLYRIAIFVIGTSAGLLLLVKPDSAEHVVTLLALCVGSTWLFLVLLVTWYVNR